MLRRNLLSFLATVCLAALGACAGAPQRATEAPTAGAVIVENPVEFTDATGLRVATRIAFPAQGRHLPVILFSHGAYSSKDEYNLILDYWAAHGYVVIAPTHRDSTTMGSVRGNSNPRSFGWRLDDMHLLASQLGTLAQKIPALAGRVDVEQVVAAGHSFGGLVAQTLGGATYFDPQSGKTISRREPVIKAVIVFSGAGRMVPILRGEDFSALTLPTLVTVGTEDLKQTDVSGYRWRREPYDLIPAANRSLLVLQGADHYLGGLVCRSDLTRQPQGPEWVASFNEITLAFMDATLQRHRGAAARWSEVLKRTAHGRGGLARTWQREPVQD